MFLEILPEDYQIFYRLFMNVFRKIFEKSKFYLVYNILKQNCHLYKTVTLGIN